MSSSGDDEIDKAQVSANREAIEMIRERFDRIEDKLQVLFRGDNGASKLSEIEKNADFRQEIKQEGLIEMVKVNRERIKNLNRRVNWVMGLIATAIVGLFGITGTTLWFIIKHI